MINKFHVNSQKEMTNALVGDHLAFRKRESNMRHISDCVDEALNFWKKSDDEKRVEYIRLVQQRRQLVRERPDNLWQVYELCKNIYELAELDRVDFNGATLTEKMKLIKTVAPFAKSRSLREGVIEYHESRNRDKWKMNFLTDECQDIKATTL